MENTANQEAIAQNALQTKDLVNIPNGNEPVAIDKKKSFAVALLEAIKADFLAVNEGMDLDFVYLGSWLTMDKKGIFVEKDGKDDPKTRVAYGDTIDVVIAQGEKRWTLWGKKDSPEDGQLIVAERELPDAKAKLAAWIEANADKGVADRYNIDSAKLCYLAYVIPTDSLAPGEFPKIYLMSFPPTATIQYGKYSFNGVYGGKYKALGIPARTGMGSVVTRIGNVEAGSGSETYLALTFEPVGLFKPEDFDIDPNQILNFDGATEDAPAGEKAL